MPNVSKSGGTPKKRKATRADRDAAAACVKHYKNNIHLFQNGASSILSACVNDPALKEFIHFIKFRLKDPEHLREKVLRKIVDAREQGKRRKINPTNLFEQITDLAGVRILHLYSDQIVQIDRHLLRIFRDQRCRIVEGPIANCWDSDADAFYKKIGFETKQRESMYASVHYTLELNPDTKIACEVQVRTLADEIWGEVSHIVNYPKPTVSVACIEQLKVLARVTSGSSWLVNSIFRSKLESEKKR